MPISFTRKGRFRLSRDGTFISEHNVVEEAYENALEDAESGGNAVYRIDPPWMEVDVPIVTIAASPVNRPQVIGGGGGGSGGGDIFTMDYSAGAEPAAGWGAEDISDGYSRTYVAGGGPSGQNAYDLQCLYAPAYNPGFFGGQFRWGWAGNIEVSDPPRGESRFFRFRLKFSADTNFRSRDWTDGSLASTTNKLLIVGDTGTEEPRRVIIEYRGTLSPVELLRLRLQIDGGSNPASTGPWPIDTWLNVQMECRSSTDMSTANGYYKIWVNNNTYASPTNEVLNFILSQDSWRFIRFGAFNSDGCYSDGVHIFRTCDFQVGTTFDSGWNI